MNRALRLLAISVALSFALVCPAISQGVNLKDQPFEANLAGGTTLRLHLHDGDFQVVGTDSDKISVKVEGKNLDLARNIKIHLKRAGDAVDLKLSHVPKKELVVTIAVPRTTNLYARMRGGDLSVAGITGDKDLELTGGDLTVQVSNPAEYGVVDASVRFGDVKGDQFGDPKGWLGNSVHKEGPGKYKLHAHVFAGDLVLKP